MKERRVFPVWLAGLVGLGFSWSMLHISALINILYPFIATLLVIGIPLVGLVCLIKGLRVRSRSRVGRRDETVMDWRQNFGFGLGCLTGFAVIGSLYSLQIIRLV